MIGARIGRQARPERAEHRGDRSAEPPSVKIPKRDIDRTVAHVIVGPHLAAEVLPDLLAGGRIAADEMRREHRRLAKRRRRADPVSHILAARAVAGLDPDRPALEGQTAAFSGNQIADPGSAMRRQSEAFDIEGKAGELDASDPGLHLRKS